VFVAIGEIPANQLAIDIDPPLDEAGFIKIDRFGRTIIPRIYAAGDITRGIRQIVKTVGEGAAAAISIFDDMTKQSMQKKE
jgi:thioredoxin reductase (NADPH)